MTSAILALRGAFLARGAADPELAALMGGAVRLHDEPPRGAEPVYAAFGEAAAQDWSTGLDRGHEHRAAITVWARPGSARTALLAAERIAALLDDAGLALEGHHLVNLRVTGIETGRDAAANLSLVTLRLRAVTEAL